MIRITDTHAHGMYRKQIVIQWFRWLKSSSAHKLQAAAYLPEEATELIFESLKFEICLLVLNLNLKSGYTSWVHTSCTKLIITSKILTLA